MSETIDLMLDECILHKPIRIALAGANSFNVRNVEQLKYALPTDDAMLVAGTRKHHRLLLTLDTGTITEKRYPPCTHGGIVQFNKCEVTPEYVMPRLRALKTLGLISKMLGHFTYIYHDRIKIVTHKETIERNFRDYKKLRYILRTN